LTYLGTLLLAAFLTISAANGADAYLRAQTKGQVQAAYNGYLACASSITAEDAATFYSGTADCERGLSQAVAHIWFAPDAAAVATRFLAAENTLVGALRSLSRYPQNETVYYQAKAANTDTQVLWKALGLLVQ
jgi:hypothetical protein